MKYLRKVKTIINFKIIKDLAIKTIKIGLFTYIKDLFENKNLINYNIIIIAIKIGLFIKISKPN